MCKLWGILCVEVLGFIFLKYIKRMCNTVEYNTRKLLIGLFVVLYNFLSTWLTIFFISSSSYILM